MPSNMPFDFKRLQYAVRLAFAMTINKSQGQSLSMAGVNLDAGQGCSQACPSNAGHFG
jgi:ATP-dependent DNA helicase PIF1